MTDPVDRVNRELADAPPVCTCRICSSPRFMFCPTGWRVLFARVQWTLNQLDELPPEDRGGDGCP